MDIQFCDQVSHFFRDVSLIPLSREISGGEEHSWLEEKRWWISGRRVFNCFG
jgi:hypothetical protein